MLHRIVITGAPASGKTLFFERLKKDRMFSYFVFFDELARQLLIENPAYRNDWKQFHIDIYNRQIKREADNIDKSFVTDRGTVDAFAFYPETALNVESTIEREYERYTSVLLLQSSATLGEKFYKTDSVRNETIQEALNIENQIQNAWSKHPNFYCIQAENSIEKKYSEFNRTLLGIIEEKL